VEHPADVGEHPSVCVGVNVPGDHGDARLLEEGGLQILVLGVKNTAEILVGVELLMDGSAVEVVGVRIEHQSAAEVVRVGVKHWPLVKVGEVAGVGVERQHDDDARGVQLLLRRDFIDFSIVNRGLLYDITSTMRFAGIVLQCSHRSFGTDPS
jgi:hypothetical protein